MRVLRPTMTLAVTLSLALACATTPPKADPPPSEEKAAPKAEDWRNERPKPGPTPKLELPKFEQATLDNGLTILVSHRPGLPLVSMQVAIRGGSAAEAKGKAGLADLTYELMLEGAGQRDALALADAFADLGTQASVGTGSDGVTIGLSVLTRNVDAALALLSDVIQRPKLEQADFDRKQNERLADLARLAGEPKYLGGIAFAAEVYGADHPYGHPGMGTPETVAGFTLDDAKAFHKARVGPANAAFIAAGDVTLEQTKAWAQAHFGAWSATVEPPPAVPAPEVSPRARILVVPKEGLAQTVVAVGRPGIEAGHADEWALRMSGVLFGGFFGSRLNMNLREDKGYTYGARASVSTPKGVGTVRAGASVRADVTGPSVAEFFNELEGLKTNPLSEEELSAGREGVIRSIPGKFETIGGLAGTAASFFLRGQPMDRLARAVKAYEGMTRAQVQAMVEKYYDPAVMRIVLVGDPKIIEEQVGALKIGELVTVKP
jgi:zinc protease